MEVLTEMVWTDYISDKKAAAERIGGFETDLLFRYFVSLYTKHVRAVIARHDLDSTKCAALKTKGLCKIFKKECGLSIGIATNLADRILSGI